MLEHGTRAYAFGVMLENRDRRTNTTELAPTNNRLGAGSGSGRRRQRQHGPAPASSVLGQLVSRRERNATTAILRLAFV
jgi:hypothetical protein